MTFQFAVRRPWVTLGYWLVFVGSCLAGLSGMQRDPSVDAFIPTDHPSYRTAEEVEQIFGLSDPIVIALQFKDGVFTRQSLKEIQRLHDLLAEVEGVRYNGVTSLASESYVNSSRGAVDVHRYIDDLDDANAIQAARTGYTNMAPHIGTLVSHDQSSAALLVEPDEGWPSHLVYRNVITAMADAAPAAAVHVGGLGAVTGFLTEVISEDVARLVPFTYLIVMLVLYIGFRDWRALLVPLPVLTGSVIGTLGIMAALGVPYYAITSALPVLLVAIAMADTIHVLTAFREQAGSSGSTADMVTASLSRVLRPISFTSLTTVIGFAAIGAVSIMPPIIHFAWFACIGIVLAWLFSLTAVPAVMVLLKMRPVSSSSGSWAQAASILTRYGAALRIVFAGLLLLGAAVATQVSVDRSLVNAFPKQAPVRVADEFLNTHFAGTAFLDVYVDSGAVDGALQPGFLRQIGDLQDFMESLPHVQKTVSVLDYIREMHRALNDNAVPGNIGATPVEITQELFLYESAAAPGTLRQELDFDRRRVLVRGVLNSRFSSDEAQTVTRLQTYVDEHFPGAVDVRLSGRVNTRYHWMSRLGESHVAGVALSLLLVLLAASYLFRSPAMGTLCVLPVVLAVLSVYTVLYLTGGYLEPATSMFAAISIGIGVDYAIHLLFRLRQESEKQQDYAVAVAATLQHVGRACMYNALGIGLGVLVLATSSLGTLQNFGFLIATATFAGLMASFVFLPALYRPLGLRRIGAVAAVCCLVWVPWQDVQAGTGDTEDTKDTEKMTLADRIEQRPEPAVSIRHLSIVLVDRAGRSREREAVVLRRTDLVHTDSLFVLAAPASLRDLAFLTHSKPSGHDQRWLFRPTAERARRLPAANRGDAFIGTDFTYADVQSHLKFDADDFVFSQMSDDGHAHWRLVGDVKTKRLQRELGYAQFTAEGGLETLLPRRINFVNTSGRSVKVITVPSFEMIEGYALPTEIVAENPRSGHTTYFKYGETRLLAQSPDQIFDAARLRKGLSVQLAALQ